MAKSGKESNFYKHGLSKNPLFYIHYMMIQRCHNPNHKHYSHYGAIGRTVCDEWRNDPKAFIEWAESHGYQKGLSLDRIDNEKGYSPDNCRWVDRYVQQNNMRRNHYLTIGGETHSISEWARIKGISKSTIEGRLQRGLSDEEAVNLPVKRGWFGYRSLDSKDYRKEFCEVIANSGLTQTIIAKELGISSSNLSYRLKRNVTREFYIKTIKAIEAIRAKQEGRNA